MAKTPRKSKKYINNKDFYLHMVEYKKKYSDFVNNNGPEPKIPDYIGKSFLLICNNLANKSNFINYSYKQEMISDALENCIIAINNFDPEKLSKNPFAYFTQIAKFAFIRRIDEEKKQLYIKHKNYFSGYYDGNDSEFNEISNDIIHDYEEKMKEKKIKKKERDEKKKIEMSLLKKE